VDLGRQLAKLRIPFIANHGQVDPFVRFYAPLFAGTVFVTTEGRMVYALPRGEAEPPESDVKGVVLTEELVGGNVEAVHGEGTAPTKVNVFHGNTPDQWRRSIPTYEAVSLGQVYEGIEVRLKAHGSQVEKLFHVAPGADPRQIRVRLEGAEGMKVTEAGELAVDTALGAVRFSRPVAYQVGSGGREAVEVAYAVRGREYGFRVGAYDPQKTLVIDPILAATFLGGGEVDLAVSLAVDGTGNAYVAGVTQSADFPGVDAGSIDHSFGGSSEAFVVKLDAQLSVTLAATFMGGGDEDGAHSIALDSTGNVYVAGATESFDFPGVDAGSADSSFGLSEAFVVKLDDELSAILAATFMGGSLQEAAPLAGGGLAIDSTGNVYVAGSTSSADFPGVGVGSADSSFAGVSEAFVAKLDGELSSILAATFLGGTGVDVAFPLALDGPGNVYVAGVTDSADFPGVDAGSADPSAAGDVEGFVVKLDVELSAILAATFLGGSFSEEAFALTLDGPGNVYVAGLTDSADFPGVDAGSADSSLDGVTDPFVAKLDGALSAILTATFLGGSSSGSVETAFALTLDSTGNVYVAGVTDSADFPGIDAGSADPSFAGTEEAFVATLDGALSAILAATFLGGSEDETAFALALDSTGSVYVAGGTSSADFPGVGPGSADSTFDFPESFVAVLDIGLSSSVVFDLDELKDLVASCRICPPDPERWLLHKIDLAISQVRKGHDIAAVNALEQFVRGTERFIRKGELPDAVGQRFIEEAEAIIAEIEGEVVGR
jgi:ribosomal protein L5